ncbi:MULTISPECIES: hypothetical protein [Inquilinus]|uniref:Uncharacterized protein n=1 Tax=Inquilinus ginsengisoli TaxID=363840 RepID=A0ABU1JKF6_9PROT|nr:hypothetical protein [Inquilinus ginsengisoli]MDR6289097.1 hypothetical protein [Inquilinus ginsengisoli]
MGSTVGASAEIIDGSALFASFDRQSSVPTATGDRITALRATFQAEQLDLGDVQRKLADAELDPPMVVVQADILDIPERFNWKLRGATLVIAARQVRIAGSAMVNLDYRSDDGASLMLFAGEITGALHAIALTPADGPQPVIFTIDAAPATGGVQIRLRADGYPEDVALNPERDLPVPPLEIDQSGVRADVLFGARV